MCLPVILHTYITCVTIHNSTSFLQWWVKCPLYSGAALCHLSGLRLQLSSQPLEGSVASSCCSLASCSASCDRKLGNVCARGMKVIVRPLPVRKNKWEGINKTFLCSKNITWVVIKEGWNLKINSCPNVIKLLLSDHPQWGHYVQNKTSWLV